MALEKIEEELGLLTVLRDAANFYSSYLQERKEEREASIAELADTVAQVEQMNQQRALAMSELVTLQAEQDRIDSEYSSIAPSIQLLEKIETIKTEIAERQEKLRKKEETLIAQERIAKSKPDDEIVQDKLKKDRAIFRGEKASEDLILQRLDGDIVWYSQRLSTFGVSVKEIEKQAQAIQSRLQPIKTAVADKSQDLTNMDEFVKVRQERVDRLGELQKSLSEHETDLANITEVARFISEVSFDVQPAPAEHTG